MAVTVKRDKNSAAVKVNAGTVSGKSKILTVNIGALDKGYSGSSEDMATAINNIVTVLEPCLIYEVAGITLTETNDVVVSA